MFFDDIVVCFEGKLLFGWFGFIMYFMVGFIDFGFIGYVMLEFVNVVILLIKLWLGMKIG